MTNLSRLTHAKHNIKSAALLKVITPLTSFVTRTVVIYTLGNVYLGLNSLFTSMLQVLSLADLGFGSAMVFSMYKPIAENDEDTVCALLSFYRMVYRIIGTIILATGIILIPFLPKLIKNTLPADLNLTALYLIRLSDTCLSYFLFSYRNCLFDASQQRRFLSQIQSLGKIILCLLQVGILLIFKSYYLFCLAIPFVQIMQNLFFYILSVQTFPNYVCRGKLPKETIQDIAQRVSGLFLFKVSHVLRNSFDSIILSMFLGLDILAKYQNYFLIITTLVGITSILTDSTLSGIGNSIAMESTDKNYRDFNTFQLLFMTMTGIICACMCCIYQPFILFWAHAGNMFPNQIMLLFVIYFFTERMGNICFQYRQASGLWSHDRIRPLVDGVTNLTLNYILVQRIGIAGVMLSTILCHIFIDSLWASSILFRYYFTKEKQSKYLLRLSFYALVTMIACTLTMAICRFLPMEGTNAFYSILFIFARAIICLGISSLLFYFSCRKLSEFSDAMAIVSRIVKRG